MQSAVFQRCHFLWAALALATTVISPASASAASNLKLTVAAGDHQTSAPGDTTADPLVVKLTGAAGAPVVGEQILFRVMSGGGVLINPNTANGGAVASLATDGQGLARIFYRQPKTNQTTSSIHADVNGSMVRLTESTTIAQTGPPASAHLGFALIMAGGDNQILWPDQISQPLSVRLINSLGAPVAQVPVTFSMQSGGGTLVRADRTTNPTVNLSTGTDGMTSICYQAPDDYGIPSRITATCGHQAIVFTVITHPILKSGLAKIDGDDQTTAPGVMLDDLLAVKVTDKGTPLAGVPLNFTVTSGGGELINTASDPPLHGATLLLKTNEDGFAWATYRQPDAFGVTSSIHVAIKGLSVNFTAHTFKPGLIIYSGNYQDTLPTQDLEAPLVAQLTDGTGHPLDNRPVTFEVVSGAGVLYQALSSNQSKKNPDACARIITASTDQNGMARAFYRQPDSAGTISRIRATADGQAVIFKEITASGDGKFDCVSDFSGNAIDNQTMALNWTNHASIAEYILVQENQNEGPWRTISIINPGRTSYVAANLDPNIPYSLRLISATANSMLDPGGLLGSSVVETPLAQLDSSWVHGSMKLSPDNRSVIYLSMVGGKPSVMVNGKGGKAYDGIGEGTPIFSPDSTRVAYTAHVGNQERIVLDGNEGKLYDGAGDGILAFSPDSKHFAYAAAVGGKRWIVFDGNKQQPYDDVAPPVFSPDSSRMAYMALKGGKQLVVTNGKEEGPYDGIGQGTLAFSADNKHLAYSAQLGAKRFVVLDGNTLKSYDDFSTLAFSPDGKRLAYTAQVSNTWLVGVDGRDDPPYDTIRSKPLFSPDSGRLAYVAAKGDKLVVVVDGKEDPGYDGIGQDTLLFSPDSKRVAYVAGSGKNQSAVVDGVPGKSYDGIAHPIFSPDGRHVAYMAGLGKDRFVVIDGKEQRPYQGIGDGSLLFSPDSRHVAYVASRGDKRWVVIDGKEGKPYDGVGQLTFSPDSQRTAYVAQAGHRQMVIVDGKEDPPRESIGKGCPVFSPDSKRVAYSARSDKRCFVVVDGKELDPSCDNILPEGRLFFDSPDQLHYLAIKGTSLNLVEETLK